jgi:hypothetical protein
MFQEPFHSKIYVFVLSEWRKAIHEGEENYSRRYNDEIGSPVHIAKIIDFARLKLISGLVTLKGAWLTKSEMSYAYTLFEEHCKSFDYFNILKFQEKSNRQDDLIPRSFDGSEGEKQRAS